MPTYGSVRTCLPLRLPRVKKSPGMSNNPVWLHVCFLGTILTISRITLRSSSFYETYRANLQLHNLSWATYTTLPAVSATYSRFLFAGFSGNVGVRKRFPRHFLRPSTTLVVARQPGAARARVDAGTAHRRNVSHFFFPLSWNVSVWFLISSSPFSIRLSFSFWAVGRVGEEGCQSVSLTPLHRHRKMESLRDSCYIRGFESMILIKQTCTSARRWLRSINESWAYN